jgi:hypothetical protein
MAKIREPANQPIEKKMKLRYLPPLIAIFTVASIIYPALAKDEFLQGMRKVYKLSEAINSCHLCHSFDEAKEQKAGGHNINDFGMDIDNLPQMRKLIDLEEDHSYTDKEWETFAKAIRLLENDDSDKDGATNLEEMTLGTFPGEKKSVPDAAVLKALREKADKEKKEKSGK